MPISYSYDAGRGLLETAVTGEVGLADVQAYFRQVAAEPWFPAPSITDLRHASPNLPSADVRAIAQLLRRLGPRLDGTPVAAVVATDVAYGLVRMVDLMVDDVVTLRAFRDRGEALAWIAEHSRPAEP
jgi:hypothetical protein